MNKISNWIRMSVLVMVGASSASSAWADAGERYGAWGISSNPIQSKIDAFKPAIRGLHITGNWGEIETAPGRYDWKSFDDQFRTVIDANHYFVGFDILVGPDSPAWIYCAENANGQAIKTPTCVPKVHVSGQSDTQSNVFPYYLDPYYRLRYYSILDKVAEHIAAFPAEWKEKILYWESDEGSTGDTGAYKGDVKDSKYAISDAEWTDFRHAAWLRMDATNLVLGLEFPLTLNTGNDGSDFEWALENIPCAWTKSGNSSHQYSFNGEINEVNRYAPLAERESGCNRIRAEFQNIYDTASWKKAPMANTYALTLSALTIGLDMLNLTGASITNAANTADLTLYDTFSKFAGVRRPADSNRAFVYFRDVPDFVDVTRFPETEFGALWDDARAYQNSVDSILADRNTSDSQKAEKITSAKQTHLNPSRIAKIRNFADFTSNPALVNPPKYGSLDDNRLYGNPNYAIYDYDFGIDMIPGNYGRNLRQLDPNGTSLGQWRIGSDKQNNTRYGRYARSFDHANGKREMIFDIADSLDHSIGMKNLRVSVTFYDRGTDQWALRYASGSAGKSSRIRVRNSGTGRWVTRTWVLPSVNFTNRYRSGDLALSYVSGDDSIFGMIEVETTTDAATVL